MRFPAGEVDLTAVCRPGSKHVLSLLVVALPLKGVMLLFNDTNAAKRRQGTVAAARAVRRRLPRRRRRPAPASPTCKVDTSVRKGEITFERGAAGPAPPMPDTRCAPRSPTSGRKVREFTSQAVRRPATSRTAASR